MILGLALVVGLTGCNWHVWANLDGPGCWVLRARMAANWMNYQHCSKEADRRDTPECRNLGESAVADIYDAAWTLRCCNGYGVNAAGQCGPFGN